MDRITFEGNFCDIAMCRESPCPYNGMCSQRETWERLKKYEDAEQHGRLVVLPCKVGDRVWVTRAYGKPFDAPREGHVRKFVVHDDELVFLEALIWMDLGEGKNEYGYRTESFGKIVHLTRDAAEAVLSKANTIPCKHGLSRHRNDIGEDEVYCELNAKWMNVSLGDCLGNCESEAALVGKGGKNE